MNTYAHLTVHDLAAMAREPIRIQRAHPLPTTGVSMGLTGTDGTTVISSPEQPLIDPARQRDKMIALKRFPDGPDGDIRGV
jgi:hypothetical protein